MPHRRGHGDRALALPILRRLVGGTTRVNGKPRRGSIERVRWSVTAAARRFPSSVSCLTRALVVEAMLRRRGYHPTLHLGVRRCGDGSAPLQAHAWVECGGRVIIGELADLSDYAVLQSPGAM